MALADHPGLSDSATLHCCNLQSCTLTCCLRHPHTHLPQVRSRTSSTLMQLHILTCCPPRLLPQVRSRTFSEEVGGEGLTLMVPFADLANHSFGHNSNFMMGADRKR